MEMHQIRYFLAVSDTLNFTRAAEDCHVAQPSLSRAIRKLEEELGGDLFRRERGQTHMTELGRSMLPLLRQCYDSALAAKQQAGFYGKSEFAPLRIGLSPTVPLDCIAPALSELGRTFPGLELHPARGTAEEMLGALRAGDLELVIAAGEAPEWDRFDVWPLFEEGFVLVAPAGHPLAANDSVTIADIATGVMIGRPYCEFASALASRLAAAGLTPEHRHESASDTDAAALVDAGLGHAVMSAMAHRSPAVRAVPIADLGFSCTVQAIGVAGRQRSVAATGLVRLLRAADWPAASG